MCWLILPCLSLFSIAEAPSEIPFSGWIFFFSCFCFCPVRMDADKMEGRVLGLLGAQNVSPTGKGDFFRKTSLTC